MLIKLLCACIKHKMYNNNNSNNNNIHIYTHISHTICEIYYSIKKPFVKGCKVFFSGRSPFSVLIGDGELPSDKLSTAFSRSSRIETSFVKSEAFLFCLFFFILFFIFDY